MTAFWLVRALSAPAAGRVAGMQLAQSIQITNRSRRGLSKAAADTVQRNHGPMVRTRKPGTHARPAAGGVPWQANSGRRSAAAIRAQTIICLPRQRRCTLGNPAGRVRATAPLERGAVCVRARGAPSFPAQVTVPKPSSRARCCPGPRGMPGQPAGRAPSLRGSASRGQGRMEAWKTITFACARRKAIAKYRMPAPVAIGYKQDFELTACREGGTHGRSRAQARG
jgi:hypothetical protein